MSEVEKFQYQIVEPRTAPVAVSGEAEGEWGFSVVRSVLWRWRIVVAVFLIVCGTAIPGVWLLVKPVYNVTGAIRVAPILTSILSGQADKGEISNYQSFLNTQAEMVTSSQVVRRVADELAAKDPAFFRDRETGLVTKIKRLLDNNQLPLDADLVLKQAITNGVIKAATERNTELIKITMEDRDPEQAETVVNAFIRAYMAVEVSSAAQGQDQNLAVLESERKVSADRLQSQRNAVRQLAQEYGTTMLGDRHDIKLQRVASLQAELTKVQTQRINLEAQVSLLEQSRDQPIAAEELLRMRYAYQNEDPTAKVLTENLAKLDQELMVARQQLAPTNPELARKTELLQILRERLQQRREEVGRAFDNMVAGEMAKAGKGKLLNLRAQLEQMAAYEQRLGEMLAQENTETIELGRKQLTIQDMQEQLVLTREYYGTILRRIQELEIERKRPARILVAYYADVALVRDKRVKYTLGLVFCALAGGVLLGVLRDKTDLCVHTPDDVTKRIGIRIIGTTASAQGLERSQLPRQIAEDYQTIRANLGLLDGSGIPKKLVVTSPGMREGKTTFAVNLATCLARSGKKVLLIDGDLRKPDIGRLLNLPHGLRGLQEVLFGKRFEEAVHRVGSVPGLDVLVADCRNAADACELLASALTSQRIDAIGQRYEYLIIDTPPVLAFPDALMWAKVADAVILTSFAGQTTAPELKEATERLARINVRVLGTVLSNVRLGDSYYRYGYRYYTQSRQPEKAAAKNRRLLLPTDQGAQPGSEQ
jgi:capsular exopolysaccharide synthesis family protein